jgi:hypothetical protein
VVFVLLVQLAHKVLPDPEDPKEPSAQPALTRLSPDLPACKGVLVQPVNAAFRALLEQRGQSVNAAHKASKGLLVRRAVKDLVVRRAVKDSKAHRVPAQQGHKALLDQQGRRAA